VRVADPHVESPPPAGTSTAQVTPEELSAADLVVVLTDHEAFPYDLVEQHARRVFDCRRVAGLSRAERL
jgi:UDP-N-acetyl-D-glucosamine dehydrogenase